MSAETDARIEDVTWLVAHGETHVDQIARRLAITTAALDQTLRREARTRPDVAALRSRITWDGKTKGRQSC